MSFVATAIGAGVVTAGVGMGLQASSASSARRQARQAAETPGLDIPSVVGEAEQLAPRTRALEQQRTAVTREQLLENLGLSIPGYEQAQAARAQNALALLRGELPPDVLSQIQRKSAAKALEGGFAGSKAAQGLNARDIGRTTLQAQQEGARLFSDILGTTPMAPLANYEFTPQQLAQLREQERISRMNALAGVASMPSAGGVVGQGLGSLGSGLTNLGFAQLGAQNRAGGGGGNNWSGGTTDAGGS